MIRMKKSSRSRTFKLSSQRQRGYAMMESLISIAIFTIGILGLIGVQSNILRQNINASFRIDASLLANEIIGMATADADNVNCYQFPNVACTSASAATFRQNWLTEVTNRLPGSDTNPPIVNIANDKTISISIFWQRPNENILNNYTMTTQIE